ncbi:MAG: enoyl-CoA hydratase/isomerase family protein [Acidimicrobiia bacterium]
MTDNTDALFERDGHIARITLNRPERGNALTTSMGDLLHQFWQEIKADPRIRCTIITGAGDRHFCTGADVDNVAATGRVRGGFDSLRNEVLLTPRQNDVWKPTICAVNGMVAGGGLHFVVDADIVVAADHATFLDTHVNVGMVGAIENIGLANRMPLGTALRMTLQGRNYRLSAERAFQLGLVEELCPRADLDGLATSIAEDICKNSPNAVSLSMRSVWSSREMPYSQAIDHGYSLLRMHWMHPDFTEGPVAFAERREPVWYVAGDG